MSVAADAAVAVADEMGYKLQSRAFITISFGDGGKMEIFYTQFWCRITACVATFHLAATAAAGSTSTRNHQRRRPDGFDFSNLFFD